MSHAKTDLRLSVDSRREEEGVAASHTADSSVSDFLNPADHGTNAKVAWPSTETHTADPAYTAGTHKAPSGRGGVAVRHTNKRTM